MTKIGRNERCYCGSGKKFKHCHGALPREFIPLMPPDPKFDALLRQAQEKAEVLDFQRKRQQGHGRPIISCEVNGTRFIAIGKRIAYGKWKTMPDFLLHHLRATLGFEWGETELAKPEPLQHPIMEWFRVLADMQNAHQAKSGEVFFTPYYGACGAVSSLAYDLYTIEHHLKNAGDEVAFARIQERLRNPDQFFGARHECRIAAILLRAGFDLTWEDESDRHSGRHGEFIATFPETDRAFWVECRMRQPDSQNSAFNFTKLVSDALRKPTELERLVFVELNLANRRLCTESGGWVYAAVTQLRKLEAQPSAADLPHAEVVISNYPEHHSLADVVPSVEMVMESFKTDRFRLGQEVDLWTAINEREKNPELEALWRSIREHHLIPSTFDGGLQGVDEASRLLIGRRYEIDDGVVGILEEAVVVEQWKHAVVILRLADGKRIMAQMDLTEEEILAWRSHPETFFGVMRPYHPPVETPLDLYDFFSSCYRDALKEQLLKLMSSYPDIETLSQLTQQELAKTYSYRLAVAAWQGNSQQPPEWMRRLKLPKPRSEANRFDCEPQEISPYYNRGWN